MTFSGVDVKADRFLVMVAEIDGNEWNFQEMTSSDISDIWRKRSYAPWQYVYQEK